MDLELLVRIAPLSVIDLSGVIFMYKEKYSLWYVLCSYLHFICIKLFCKKKEKNKQKSSYELGNEFYISFLCH